MKSDLISAVVSPPQEIAPPQSSGGVDLRAQAARDRTSIAPPHLAADARTASGSDKAGAPASMGAPAPAAGRNSGGDSGPSTGGQRVALSRTRLEAMMLEAQAASTSGDVQRARSIARAVKMEAGAIRDALRNDADAAQADAAAAAAAARAVQDAQEAARRAAARAASADDREGLAPWSGGSTLRAATLAESAPLGTPTTNLHRSAFEALRRAQEILDLLSRVDAGDRSRADTASAAAGAGAAGALLLNQIEAEDGALLDGWNLLA